ncbi:MAG: hypothetical protein JJU19_13695 [Pararhodobacter sp.]|nr:hypothetical protein [Pararhodobacter sp.]
MTANPRPFDKSNPVNGFTGASSFSLNDGRKKQVGLWNEAWAGPDFAPMREAYHRFVEVARHRTTERATLAQARIADGGRVIVREKDERLAREHLRSVLTDAKKALQLAEVAQQKAIERRAGLTFKAGEVSPGDFAGAIRRERIRQKLEAMTLEERRAALKNPCKDTVAALAEMPPSFSPVGQKLHMEVIEAAFEKENAETLAQLDFMEQAAQTTLRAAQAAEAVARESLQDRLMLKQEQVESLVAEIMGEG